MAYNGTVTIADPPTSFFDLQALFLYAILASAFAGAGYLVYSTYSPSPGKPAVALLPSRRDFGTCWTNGSWIKTVLPKKKGPKKEKKKEPVVATGAVQNYEEWIPQHHLKKESTPARKRKA